MDIYAILGSLTVSLVIFLPVFWDTIPTRMAHDYYCKNEAGFTQYKTLEQWKAENLGTWETLRYYPLKEQDSQEKQVRFNEGYDSAKPVNLRFWIYSSDDKDYAFGNIRRREKFFTILKLRKLLVEEYYFKQVQEIP